MRIRSILLTAAAAIAFCGSVSATTYSFNQNAATYGKGEAKITWANCPAGFISTGGGYSTSVTTQPITFVTSVFAQTGDIHYTTAQTNVPAFVVSLNQPSDSSGSGWAIGGIANAETTVTVFVMCASRN